ncbi:MAG TPA: hypothetical protein VGM17_07925 [Rhizomicrobium sp.]
MIVGEHSRHKDIDVNPLKAKQLTNIPPPQRTKRCG